jgi:hypothetical protein
LVFIWLGTWLGESVMKKLIENMFSGRQTLRQTLIFGVRRIYRIQMEESAAGDRQTLQ